MGYTGKSDSTTAFRRADDGDHETASERVESGYALEGQVDLFVAALLERFQQSCRGYIEPSFFEIGPFGFSGHDSAVVFDLYSTGHSLTCGTFDVESLEDEATVPGGGGFFYHRCCGGSSFLDCLGNFRSPNTSDRDLSMVYLESEFSQEGRLDIADDLLWSEGGGGQDMNLVDSTMSIRNDLQRTDPLECDEKFLIQLQPARVKPYNLFRSALFGIHRTSCPPIAGCTVLPPWALAT